MFVNYTEKRLKNSHFRLTLQNSTPTLNFRHYAQHNTHCIKTRDKAKATMTCSLILTSLTERQVLVGRVYALL